MAKNKRKILYERAIRQAIREFIEEHDLDFTVAKVPYIYQHGTTPHKEVPNFKPKIKPLIMYKTFKLRLDVHIPKGKVMVRMVKQLRFWHIDQDGNLPIPHGATNVVATRLLTVLGEQVTTTVILGILKFGQRWKYASMLMLPTWLRSV